MYTHKRMVKIIQLTETLKNPIVEQRADPWVYKHTDGYYYFTASVPEYDRIVKGK
jgi:GH43 family beta-xylosidase